LQKEELKYIKNYMDEMLTKNMIEESASQLLSPILLVKKKTGQTHFVWITESSTKTLKEPIFISPNREYLNTVKAKNDIFQDLYGICLQ
jgi:hypothetical protein